MPKERDDLELAKDHADLAAFYIGQKRFAVAEPNLRRAIDITQKRIGPEDPL